MKNQFSRKKSSNPRPVLSPDTDGLRFCLLGGFLGAGKTSFLRAFAAWLGGLGLKVGLVANDQAGGLVDALRFQIADQKSQIFPVDAVTGGYFCCKADDLVERLKAMAAGENPDIIVAEPVGSCTDLVATLGFSMVPYLALADGRRLLRAARRRL